MLTNIETQIPSPIASPEATQINHSNNNYITTSFRLTCDARIRTTHALANTYIPKNMSITDELPWNTTRCNRLLRPLSSKLSKLHKELDRPRSANGERRAAAANAFSIKASPRKAALVSQSALSRKPRTFEKRKDPDWMPDAGSHGANRKTYGARGAKKANNAQRAGMSGSSTRPGELPFTPLISRIGGSFQASSPVDASPARKPLKKQRPAQCRNAANTGT